jgi:uncharacterized membrane protein
LRACVVRCGVTMIGDDDAARATGRRRKRNLMDLGKLHVLLVHFPIALALAAVAADVLWLITRRLFFRNAGAYCLVLGTIAAVPTIITGLLLTAKATWSPERADLAEDHEHMALITAAVMITAVVMRGFWAKSHARWHLVAYGILMAALVVCISITGHLGGQIAFGRDYLSSLFR